MRKTGGSSYFGVINASKLTDAMNGDTLPALQYAPRGAGHGLIGLGIALLLYGFLFANATASHLVVQVDEVPRVEVVPGDAFTIEVPGPGVYELYSTDRQMVEFNNAYSVAEGYRRRVPTPFFGRADLPNEARAWYAQIDAEPLADRWIVESPKWTVPSGSTEPSAMWAIPAADPPIGMHVGTFRRNVAVAMVGAIALAVGSVRRIRFVRSVRRYSASIDEFEPPRPHATAEAMFAGRVEVQTDPDKRFGPGNVPSCEP